jgi:alkyl sulfatase BDS1-like metallo-beta-lactamase superfamily hydrolase
LANATLTNLPGFISETPDLTLTINRTDLEMTMAGEKTLDAQLADGTAKSEGDLSVLGILAGAMVDFDPFFEVLPGTRMAQADVPHAGTFEAVPGKVVVE